MPGVRLQAVVLLVAAALGGCTHTLGNPLPDGPEADVPGGAQGQPPAQPGASAPPAPTPARFVDRPLWDHPDRQDPCDPSPGVPRSRGTAAPVLQARGEALVALVASAFGDEPSPSPPAQSQLGTLSYTFTTRHGQVLLGQPGHKGIDAVYSTRNLTVPGPAAGEAAAKAFGWDTTRFPVAPHASGVGWHARLLVAGEPTDFGMDAVRAQDDARRADVRLRLMTAPADLALVGGDQAAELALQYERCWQARQSGEAAADGVSLWPAQGRLTAWNDTLAYLVQFRYSQPGGDVCGPQAPAVVDAVTGRILGHAWGWHCDRMHRPYLEDLVRRPAPAWVEERR
ncbi:MAG TPA: hypothetical protein VFH47_08140 [Candidatus Thermoplasmatota archaeon]|nr:hypothetical protein [Candidatus Thermoplasmatota archaeon]